MIINDANINTVVSPLKLYHTTSGTAAAGIGTGIEFYSEDASGNIELVGTILTNFVDATHATQTSRISIKPAIDCTSGI